MDAGKTKNIVPSASYVSHRTVISDIPSSQDTSQYAISKFCQDGTRVIVVFCSEFTIFTVAHFQIPYFNYI
jgi:hypothetical protein